MKLKDWLILICVLLLLRILWKILHQSEKPIRDIWVINMDTDVERWKTIETTTRHMKAFLHRWPATVGKNMQRTAAHMEGVSQMVILHTDCPPGEYYSKTSVENNAGKVGCWLSHKRLLQYLQTLSLPDTHAHLIVEDDIMFHDGFLEDWSQISRKVPNAWDMIYLGIHKPILNKPVDKPVYRGVTSHTDSGNWGTHAYIVKHGSIPTILSKLRFMTHEIDVQYNLYFDELNVFVIYPNILRLHPELSMVSSIESEELVDSKTL